MKVQWLLAIAVLLLSACSHRIAESPLFHVTAVTPCEDIEVVGVFQGNEYALHIDRESAHMPLYVACWERITTADVGKDFPATLGGDDTLVINVPSWGAVPYHIEFAKAK